MKCNYVPLLSGTLISSILLTTQRLWPDAFRPSPGGYQEEASKTGRERERGEKKKKYIYFLPHYFLKGLPGEFNKCHRDEPTNPWDHILACLDLDVTDWLGCYENETRTWLTWLKMKMSWQIFFIILLEKQILGEAVIQWLYWVQHSYIKPLIYISVFCCYFVSGETVKTTFYQRQTKPTVPL